MPVLAEPPRHPLIRVGGWLRRTGDADDLRFQLDLAKAAGWDVAVVVPPRYAPMPRLKESPLPLLVDTSYRSWPCKEACLAYPSLVALLLAGQHILHPVRYRPFPRWWLDHPREGHVLRPERLPDGRLPGRLRALRLPEWLDTFPEVLLDSLTAPQLQRPFYWLVDHGLFTTLTIARLLSLRATALGVSTGPVQAWREPPEGVTQPRGGSPGPRRVAAFGKSRSAFGLEIVET